MINAYAHIAERMVQKDPVAHDVNVNAVLPAKGTPSQAQDSGKEDLQRILQRLENDATLCASNLVQLMENMRSSLSVIEAISKQHMEVCHQSSAELTDVVNLSIMSTSALISKAQELSTATNQIHHLSVEIKDIKKSLDVFEPAVQRLFKT